MYGSFKTIAHTIITLNLESKTTYHLFIKLVLEARVTASQKGT